MHRFFLPRARVRWQPWFAASVVAHAVFIALLLTLQSPPHRPRVVTVILEPSGGVPELPAPLFTGPPGTGSGPRGPVEAPSPTPPERPVLAEAPPPPSAPPAETPTGIDTTSVGLVLGPVGGGEGEDVELAVGTHRRLGPAYGNGFLWVPPADVPYREAEPFDPAVHAARIDSAMAERILAFIDTMPPDSFAVGRPPKWTKDINGKPWGFDGQWIYLGDIKIPSAILALLPMPSGNYDQALQAERLQQIRADIVQAARRARNAADFKRYVGELRQRKDEEREEKRDAPLPAPRDTLLP